MLHPKYTTDQIFACVYACGFFFHILYHQTIKGQIRFLKCEDVTDFVDENRE